MGMPWLRAPECKCKEKQPKNKTKNPKWNFLKIDFSIVPTFIHSLPFFSIIKSFNSYRPPCPPPCPPPCRPPCPPLGRGEIHPHPGTHLIRKAAAKIWAAWDLKQGVRNRYADTDVFYSIDDLAKSNCFYPLCLGGGVPLFGLRNFYYTAPHPTESQS